MGIVNSCEKSTRQFDNEISMQGLNTNQHMSKRVLQQQNVYQMQNIQAGSENKLGQKVENKSQAYFKSQQENINPMISKQVDENKNSKSAYSKMIDRGLMENSSYKQLKTEQNDARMLNSVHYNNLINSTSLMDQQRNRTSQSYHVTCTNNKEITSHQSTFNINCNNIKYSDFDAQRSSRPSVNSSNLVRSTYSASLHVANERKRVKEIYEDGSIYEGQVLNGMRDGQGTFTYANQGAKYVGQWVKGSIEGYGILYFADNKIAYEGKWMDNKFNGNGVVYNENGEREQVQNKSSYDYTNFENIGDEWMKYEGNFLDDQKYGLGTLYLKNGEKYVGNFNKDSVDGNGAFYKLDGTIILGIWAGNSMILETSRINC